VKYRLKFLPETVADRERIRNYLSQFYPNTAKKFFANLKSKTTRLKTFPYSCPVYDDDTSYRKLVVDEYLVFYVVNDDDHIVEVHRIFHGTQNLSDHL